MILARDWAYDLGFRRFRSLRPTNLAQTRSDFAKLHHSQRHKISQE